MEVTHSTIEISQFLIKLFKKKIIFHPSIDLSATWTQLHSIFETVSKAQGRHSNFWWGSTTPQGILKV